MVKQVFNKVVPRPPTPIKPSFTFRSSLPLEVLRGCVDTSPAAVPVLIKSLLFILDFIVRPAKAEGIEVRVAEHEPKPDDLASQGTQILLPRPADDPV